MTIDILGKGRGPGLSERLFRSGRARLVALAVVATVILSVQTVIARHPTLRTDLATVVLLYLAMELDLKTGLVMTLVVGYVSDVFSGEPRGLYMASLVIVFLVVRLIVFRVVGARWLIVTALSLLATLMALVVRLTIEWLLGPETDASIGRTLPATFLGAAAFGYPIYRLMGRIDQLFLRRQESM